MINRIKAKIFTKKITGEILGAPVQNIGGFDRIIFCETLPIEPAQNTLYINKTDGTGNWFTTEWHQFAVSELDPVFLAWLGSNPTSGTNTGDQVGDGITITGSGTISDPFVAVSGAIDLTPYLLADTTLQSASIPEPTSLFSFWKIGVGRLKIAWSDLLNTIHHNQLIGLDWLSSGHVGNANKIFGSDANGVAKEYALTDFDAQNSTNNATSGIITLAKQTVTTLTSTLTNAHTLTIIPELPTVFTNRNYSEVVLTVGATAPAITWSAPSGVTFKWSAPLGTPSAGLKINTKHKLFYDWESATSCLISRREL